ncbi:hypothetical protein [Pseudoxanthomonas winnipegensis]|uniref:Uncharacterized protein n=1 Tax=Pseudoxanthomonas winnipegensis TaxID=2480810 RepID=A0A4Q8LLZ1_9GAMM|nr:hypothetical protein [Pseudoxanthomonas winnipegensis]RZZ85024.1 hypothetical protein EA662_11270 [Pseudoxanthomonas winnipegensis]TAA31106.1 hypothetical protein EA661_05860 [Pseudoxanthomonas winnipegensis]TAA38583.1 hypothetical protein EAT51_16515 [Pseudoxanthomonas winnipegensis]TBV77617.1 hypothetical protein EYC46_04780 [Pseudoxanthomonas winnipegensis]
MQGNKKRQASDDGRWCASMTGDQSRRHDLTPRFDLALSIGQRQRHFLNEMQAMRPSKVCSDHGIRRLPVTSMAYQLYGIELRRFAGWAIAFAAICLPVGLALAEKSTLTPEFC